MTVRPTPAPEGTREDLRGRIVLLIASLASPEKAKRESARLALEAIGPPAVGHLLPELSDMAEEVRAEAIRALGAIGDPEAIPALIGELEDEESICRWRAARALVAIGHASIVPILRVLEGGTDSVSLRQGCRHILVELEKGRLEILHPVLLAFLSDIPEIAIRGAASVALAAMERSR